MICMAIWAGTNVTRADEIMFKEIGNYHQATSTIHLSIPLDFSPFRRHCDQLKRPIQLHLNNTDKISSASNRSHVRSIMGVCDEVDQLTILHLPYNGHRFPRQLGIMVAGITSVFSIYQNVKILHLAHQLQEDLHQQLGVLQHLGSRLGKLTWAVAEQAEDLHKVLQRETIIQEELDMLQWQRDRDTLLNEFAANVHKASQGMQELRRGHLSPSIISRQEAANILHELQQRAQQLGGQPAIQHPDGLYQLPVTYVTDEPFHLIVLLHVDVIEEKMQLFRYHPTPFLVKDNDSVVALIATQHKRLLAISPNVHQELDDTDLDGCYKRGADFICSNIVAFHTRLQATCLGSLYASDMAAVRDLCDLRQTNATWAANVIDSKRLSIYFRERTAVQISCPGRTRNNTSLHGSNVIIMDPNCTLTAGDLKISARSDILLRIPMTTNTEWETASFLHGRTPVEIRDIRRELLGRNISPAEDIRGLLRQEANAHAEDSHRSSHEDHTYGLYAMAAVTVALLGGLLLRYGRLVCQAATSKVP